MITLDNNQNALLAILRNALWGEAEELPEADWEAVGRLAKQQGVQWMLYPGAKPCSTVPADRLQLWRGMLFSSMVQNERLNAVQNQLFTWLSERKIRAAVLKGTSCSAFYPNPEARTLGDIDILIDEENMETVGRYLQEQGYAAPDYDHDFHARYCAGAIVIEVHHAATEIPEGPGGKRVAEEMSKFLDECRAEKAGELTFPTLSDRHQALMLLLHMERHMLKGGIGLRQLCDWCMFVNGSDSAHWDTTLELLNRCGLTTYAKVITKTCVQHLGLAPERAVWCMDVDDSLADAMLEDLLRGGNFGAAQQETMSNLFTDRNQLSTGSSGRVRGLLSTLSKLAYFHWPWTKKYKIILPVFWVYIPLRYWVRSLLGLREKKNVLQVMGTSDRRQKLYQALHLYEIK